MKNTIFLSFICGLFSLIGHAQVTTVPSPPEAAAPVTINFTKTGTGLASYNGVIYAHIGVTVNGVQWQNVKGSWGVDATQPALTQLTATTYSLSIGPSLYTYFGVPTTSTITQICVVFRGAGPSPTAQTTDYFINVGAFQVNLTAPLVDSATVINSGENLTITATNTGGNASYNLIANGTSINANPSTASYSYTHTGITSNQSYSLVATLGTSVITKKFSVIVNPGTISEALPSSSLEDGINYDTGDATKATLVLNAPFKDFIYVAGSFNNWQPDTNYAMKKDPATGKFWLALSGLVPNQVYTYQYWVCDVTNRPANSPAIVKTADPFSTLVLSPFDDPEIISLGVYPNLPAYPAGQEREVTVLQTGPNAYYNYNWSSATTNFVKPKKKDLVIYEVLVRDFDSHRSYQDLIDRIDYFKNLKINAIQLMPIMEFEGNESWGYNTVYHLAQDKRYGSPAKLKEFIDLCHQNGIAVILDVALNHVFGRSPLERMWMLDTNNDGWGNGISAENPYCNTSAMHSYSVGSDLNHFREPDNLTNTYVVRTIQHWIRDYKIDGFRWDLTKGFTNQCPSNVAGGQEVCTNGYRTDRVAKLKWYADKQWEEDPNFYVIFEHLGSGGSYTEEVEWANYLRSGNDKGVMQWRKMTDPYANLLKGNATNLSGIADATDRFVGYAESHDEERVTYKAFNEAGQTQGDLAKIHLRSSAMGAVHLLVPGPKMIWHFGDLGWDKSLWTCNNGTVSYSSPDCKLDTKPQPQWNGNWLADTNRSAIYNNWARMIDLKKSEPVFENGSYAWNFTSTGHPRLDIWTSTAQTPDLSYVFVLTNFSNTTYNVAGGFPFVGTWTNLMDNTTFSVAATNMNISIEPGGFRVFSNNPSSLSVNTMQLADFITLYPNPSSDYFSINANMAKVQVFSVTGQLVKTFPKQSGEFQYSIGDLDSGIYFVKATDESNREKTMKLIKQ